MRKHGIRPYNFWIHEIYGLLNKNEGIDKDLPEDFISNKMTTHLIAFSMIEWVPLTNLFDKSYAEG